MPSTDKCIVRDNFLLVGSTPVSVGSPSWYEWLSVAKKFSFKGQSGCFMAQCEKRRNKAYWYAYRDPVRNSAIVSVGVVDNALATLTILALALTVGVSAWFIWASAALTAFFCVALFILMPQT